MWLSANADEYVSAARVTNSILRTLSTCTTERLGQDELDLLLAAQVKEVEKQAGSTSCIGNVREKTIANIPRIKGEIFKIQNGGMIEQFSNGLGVNIGSDGRVSEK